MAKYVMIPVKENEFPRSYGLPLVNLIPAIIWSIPLKQYVFPDAGFLATLGICGAFIFLYIIITLIPVVCAIPDIAGIIIYVGLFWALADMIGHDTWRIVVKVIIAIIVGLVEICVFANSTVPWMEKRFPGKPNIRKVE